jgi:hypothetical protein
VAEDVAAAAPAHSAADQPAPSRAEKAHASAYYTRFSLAYTLLIMLGVAGIGALVVILLRPEGAKQQAWSTFRPTGSASEIERQIATQVSSEYKASATNRLASVYPGPLATTNVMQTGSGGQVKVQVPVTLIAVQPDVSTGKHAATDFSFYHPESTVVYEMCGFDDPLKYCGIASDTGADPTPLLHRETLELALYTLKYVPNTNAVVTYLPPPPNPGAAATAVFFSHNDLKANLRLPLARTLQPQGAFLGTGVPDAIHVAELTHARVYTYQYQTLPGDGTAALVLTPVNGGQ